MEQNTAFIAENHKLAKEYSQSGTIKNFMLRQGFMPHDEKEAEAIAISIFKSEEDLRWEVESLRNKLKYIIRATGYKEE